MKKFLCCVLVSVFILAFVPAVNVYADGRISVTIDGVPVQFDGQQPASVDGRTLVPVRGVFEQLGFDVDWNRGTQQATLTSGDYTVILTIGSPIFTTNGERHTLDVPAQLIGGSTMIPIRLPLESVGFYVDWNRATETVIITRQAPDITAPVVTVPPPTTPTRNFSAAHLNAPRPTPERFMELALELEYLAGTDVANGFLNGVLYRGMRDRTADGYLHVIQQVDTARTWKENAFQAVIRHPEFTRWYTANRTAIGRLAPLAYTNLAGNEVYAPYVVLLAYYGIFGAEGLGFSSFGMGTTIEVNRVLTLTDAAGLLADATSSQELRGAFGDLFLFETWNRERYGGDDFQDLIAAGWRHVRGISNAEFFSRFMTPQQVRATAARNMTGLEALALLEGNAGIRHFTIFRDLSLEPARLERATRVFPTLHSLDFRTMLDVYGDRVFIAEEAGRELPMFRTEQRNGTRAPWLDDVNRLLWFYDQGIIDSSFDPYGPVTLGEFITIWLRYQPLVNENNVNLDTIVRR